MPRKLRWSVLPLTGIAALALTYPVGAQEAFALTPAAAEKLLQQAVAAEPAEAPFRRRLRDDFSFRPDADAGSFRDPTADLQLRWQFPELSGAALTRAGEAVQAACRARCIARFEDARRMDVVLLSADRPADIAQWHASLTRVNSAEFLQLVLIHLGFVKEVEQTFQASARLAYCHDAEEFQVLLSLQAGASLWLTRRVAERLGSESLMPLLAEMYLRVPEQFPDNAVRLVCVQVLRRRYDAAVEGAAFFEALARERDFSLERVFTHPPRQLAWLRRPDLYLRSQRDKRADLKAKLALVEKLLPESAWQAAQQPWTADMVRQVAALVGWRAQAERAVRSWEEARSLVWINRQNPARQAALSLVRFENDAGARNYFGFALELQRKRDEASGNACTSTQRVLDSRSATPAVRDADEAVRIDKRIQIGTKGEPLSESILLARKGDLVIELTCYGMAADLAWAERTVNAVVMP